MDAQPSLFVFCDSNFRVLFLVGRFCTSEITVACTVEADKGAILNSQIKLAEFSFFRLLETVHDITKGILFRKPVGLFPSPRDGWIWAKVWVEAANENENSDFFWYHRSSNEWGLKRGCRHWWEPSRSQWCSKANVNHQPIVFLPGKPTKGAMLVSSSG